MTDVKIHFKAGSVEFSGEGDKEWLEQQLDKLITKLPQLFSITNAINPQLSNPANTPHAPMSPDISISNKTLPAFLKEKSATSNQVKKFLATAVWLEAKGKRRISTTDVAKALKDSNQNRLGNPADCLNKNVGKGFCEKDGNEFFVTTEGKDSL